MHSRRSGNHTAPCAAQTSSLRIPYPAKNLQGAPVELEISGIGTLGCLSSRPPWGGGTIFPGWRTTPVAGQPASLPGDHEKIGQPFAARNLRTRPVRGGDLGLAASPGGTRESVRTDRKGWAKLSWDLRRPGSNARRDAGPGSRPCARSAGAPWTVCRKQVACTSLHHCAGTQCSASRSLGGPLRPGGPILLFTQGQGRSLAAHVRAVARAGLEQPKRRERIYHLLGRADVAPHLVAPPFEGAVNPLMPESRDDPRGRHEDGIDLAAGDFPPRKGQAADAASTCR